MAGKSEKLPPDCQWRDGKIYFKKRYPQDARDADPTLPTHHEKSLRTSDPKLAGSRAAEHRVAYDKRCAEALAPKAPSSHEEWLKRLTPEQQEAVIAIACRVSGSSSGDIDDAADAMASLAFHFIGPAMAAHKYHANPSPFLDQSFTGQLEQAARSGILRGVLEAASGLAALNYPLSELPENIREAVAAQAEQDRKPTLLDALALRAPDAEERYQSQKAWAVKLFHGIVGEKPLEELKPVDLTTFEQAMRQMPVGKATINAIQDGRITVRQAIETAGPELRRLEPLAARKHVSFVKSLSGLAHSKGLYGDKHDPFSGFKPDRIRRNTDERKHFNDAELDALFAEIEKSWLGEKIDRAWICVLALLHGTRREETCQLLKTDIKEVGGIWCLHVTTQYDDEDEDDRAAKRLKNANARRVIPIHHRVLEAGFLEYVNASKGPRIFMSLTADPDGRWGSNFGKRFGELRKKAGIIVRRKRTFHGFRHTAITAMRDAEWTHSVQLAISGHAPGGVNDNYGAPPPPKVTKPWVDKLTFDVKALDSLLLRLKAGVTPP